MIFVVVPALNEEGRITSCLESLRSQSYDDYELVIVDGGSSDRTVKLAEKYTDEVIVLKGPVGAARNIGVKRSRREILAFVDADTVACRLPLYIVSLYLFNNFLTFLTGRSIRNYPPVRSSKLVIAANLQGAVEKLGRGKRQCR